MQEVGPIVYGYSMTIRPDGKPRVREFGNVKRPSGFGFGLGGGPEIKGEREPIVDVVTTENEIKVTVEIPGVTKDKIKIDVYDNTVEERAKKKNFELRIVLLNHEDEIQTLVVSITMTTIFNRGGLSTKVDHENLPRVLAPLSIMLLLEVFVIAAELYLFLIHPIKLQTQNYNKSQNYQSQYYDVRIKLKENYYRSQQSDSCKDGEVAFDINWRYESPFESRFS